MKGHSKFLLAKMEKETFEINPSPNKNTVKYFTLSVFFILTLISIVSNILTEAYFNILLTPIIIGIFVYLIHLVFVGEVLITKVHYGTIEMFYGYRYLMFVKRIKINVIDVKSVTFFNGYKADFIIYRMNDNKKYSRIFHPHLNSWWEKDYKKLLQYFEEKNIPVFFFGPSNYDWNGLLSEKYKYINEEKYPWLTPKNIWTGGKYLN